MLSGFAPVAQKPFTAHGLQRGRKGREVGCVRTAMHDEPLSALALRDARRAREAEGVPDNLRKLRRVSQGGSCVRKRGQETRTPMRTRSAFSLAMSSRNIAPAGSPQSQRKPPKSPRPCVPTKPDAALLPWMIESLPSRVCSSVRMLMLSAWASIAAFSWATSSWLSTPGTTRYPCRSKRSAGRAQSVKLLVPSPHLEGKGGGEGGGGGSAHRALRPTC